ncbi:FHA domain-containing protein [Azotosporobacter soli]|uniref:FHA domain-containing protein n=1 Tax=Azotosporobacter soli TaxID=3055040 RepID=UPI0031FF29A8
MMPSRIAIWNMAAIFLHYTFLTLLYYFIYRVLRSLVRQLRERPAKRLPVRLLVVAGALPNWPSSFTLQGDAIMIGRSTRNDVVIEDSFVSAEHACIAWQGDGYWLEDLESTNKTFLNGREIKKPVCLTEGDRIGIGPVTLEFRRGDLA